MCLRSGVTQVGEIAKELGYANHSPVSKKLAAIRRKAALLLGVDHSRTERRPSPPRQVDAL